MTDGATNADARGASTTGVDPRPRLILADEVDDAADLLARAFMEEPGKVALLPDAEQRYRFVRHTARVRLRAALPFASAFGTERDGRLAGVAIWQPPGVKPNALVVGGGMLGALVSEGRGTFPAIGWMTRALWQDRRAMVRVIRSRNRSAGIAAAGTSWYLSLLGTDAAYRRRGVARSLLDHVLRRCDDDGLPCWTETSDEVNVAIYERFGFELVGEAHGGASIPSVWVLRREARPSAPR